MSEILDVTKMETRPTTVHRGEKSIVCGTDILPWTCFKEEKSRIRTFLAYPTRANKSALVLAENGFVYIGTGRDDTVRCYSCTVEIRDWQPLDVVPDVHKMRSPNCSIVTCINCENIPIDPHSIIANIFPRVAPQNKPQFATKSESMGQRPPVVPVAHGPSITNNSPHELTPRSTQTQATNNVATTNTATPVASSAPGTTTASSAPGMINAATPTASSAPGMVNAARPTASSAPEAPTASSAPEAPPASSAPGTTNAATLTVSSAPGITTASSAPDTTSAGDTQVASSPTYDELGITTKLPKHPNYALRAKRLESFKRWPRDHHLIPEDLADSGFYYAGYGDCARCFYCGGGLRNWDDEDDVWVEHARWFPRCVFMHRVMGPMFVQTVQELHKTIDVIPYSMVIESMGGTCIPNIKENPLKKDPAVKAILEHMPYPEKDVIDCAKNLKNETGVISADALLQLLYDQATATIPVPNPTAKDEAAIREIKEINNQLRHRTVCKICMDKEVNLVYLPCGHLVSCSECGSALINCPICRVCIKGVVHAFL